MNGFDSIQVRFKNTKNNPSPFANTRIVPFTGSYLKILKSIIDDVKTEYFWFFSSFMNLNTMDLDYIPEQHQKQCFQTWVVGSQRPIWGPMGNTMDDPND